jgi:RNA polymerase sigma factor (sigma-70 family)
MSEAALLDQPYSESIIQSARNGDQEAMRELYDTTKNYAWFIAKRYLQNDSDVEDVLQEVYLNAFSKLDTFEEGMPFKPWLHRIVSNKCIDSIRKNKHVFVSPDEIGELTDENEDAIPGEWLERSEKRRDIIKIIDALPQGQRTAVTLFYLENYSISQIAQTVGVSAGTVKYNLHHGRNKIKEAVMREAEKGNKLYSLVPIPP